MIFAFLSAVSHAAWNTVAKQGAGAGLPLLWASNLIAMAILLPIAMLLLVHGNIQPSCEWLWAGAVGALLHTVYSIVLQRGYLAADAAIVYPVSRGIAPVLVAIAGMVLWQQRLGAVGWLGIAMVSVAAVILVGRAVMSTELSARQVGWTLAIGGAVAAYTLWDAWAVVTLQLDALGYYVVLGGLQTIGLTVIVRRRMREGIRLALARPRTAISLAILVPASYLFALAALSSTPVAVVAAVRSSSIVLASIAAWLWLGETLSMVRLLSCLLAAAGVAVLAFG